MNISPFKVEEWMNAYETQATINIAETCVNSVSLDELFALTGENKQAFLNAFCQRRLTYGDIVGSDALREGIPDALRSMAVCFQAGLSLLQTFQQVASEVQGPLGTLFARAAHQLETGEGAGRALEVLRRGSAGVTARCSPVRWLVTREMLFPAPLLSPLRS